MASEFFDKVYTVVRQIPEGRVTTYGHIARFLGTGLLLKRIIVMSGKRSYLIYRV